jgi:hypothetical protein
MRHSGMLSRSHPDLSEMMIEMDFVHFNYPLQKQVVMNWHWLANDVASDGGVDVRGVIT